SLGHRRERALERGHRVGIDRTLLALAPLDQRLGLLGEHQHAGDVRHLQRAVRLVQVDARVLQVARRAGLGPEMAVQLRAGAGERLPDLRDAPRQRDDIDALGSVHHATRKRDTEFLSSRASSESCRIEPAVCCVPSLVCSVTSRIRWMLCATSSADSAWFSVVREMRMIRSASSFEIWPMPESAAPASSESLVPCTTPWVLRSMAATASCVSVWIALTSAEIWRVASADFSASRCTSSAT